MMPAFTRLLSRQPTRRDRIPQRQSQNQSAANTFFSSLLERFRLRRIRSAEKCEQFHRYGIEGDSIPILVEGDGQREMETVTTRARLKLACLSFFAIHSGAAQAQSADRAPDTIAARVLACASCHGAQGQGTSDEYFPRLAGKPSGYLYNQLVAFRDGRRKYPPMNYLLEFLPDTYLKEIAAYFASQRPPLPAPAVPVVSDEILAKGAALVTEGDPQRAIPACSSCHGPTFTGMEPAIPGLLGPARHLHQRAARSMALWDANRRRAGLHADRRGPSDGG